MTALGFTGQGTFGQFTPGVYGASSPWQQLTQQQYPLQQLVSVVPQQLQQIAHVLPQQIQQLNNLQQQIFQLQQWVQAVPLQLLQLQQLVHTVSHYVHSHGAGPFQGIQPFSTPYAPTPGLYGSPTLSSPGLGFSGQSASVM